MGVADRSEARKEAPGAVAERAQTNAAATGLAAVALTIQRAAGNRTATAWAQHLQRKPKAKPKPQDPIDTAIKKKEWAKAADALSELPAAEIETRLKKLKAKQRESLMQGAREIERTAWTEPVIQAMEKVDPKSANIGSLRWARASGFTARAGQWFHALGTEAAHKIAHELAFSKAQLTGIIADEKGLETVFKDVWAYVPKSERMLYVMTLLVDTHGYPVNGAAGIVGNLAGESALIPSRVEGSAEWSPTRTGGTDWTDEQIRDRDKKAKKGPSLPGVGLAQWTTKERREGFFARPEGTALLYDMDGQVDYLVDELGSKFAKLNKKLLDPKITVQNAADLVLEKFEAPADPEASRSARRANADKAAKLYNDANPPAPAAN
jgi:hypothetical protein